MDHQEIQEEVSLKSYTTLHVGGNARFLTILTHTDQVPPLMDWALKKNLPWVVMGRGSNVLASDRGFSGLVIINRIESEAWEIEGDLAKVTVGAGVNLASLAARSAKLGWSGLEFACGIPASIGGAVAMNAGAHGKNIQDCLFSACAWSNGSFVTFEKNSIQFKYRESRFHHLPEIVVGATFLLQRDESALERVREMTQYRLRTQPWKAATAGCFFRNPDTLIDQQRCSAGALIDRAGLKGFHVGDAQVSELHANFLVNHSQASAKDFMDLCHHIQHQVQEKFGCSLQTEVRYLDDEIKKMRSL